MALTGFIVIATETMPAGLLHPISAGLHTSEGAAGQLVSAYALGTVIAAVPAILLTQGARRKPLLLIGILGFLVTNTVTALAPDLAVILIARLVAGAFSGLLWGMLAGYARRIVPEELKGRALAIAMAGTPVALAIGTPLGSWIGTTVSWRWSFGAMSILAVVALVLAGVVAPNVTGEPAALRLPLRRVVAIPGVAAILLVVFTWMLAHNIMYTYISSYLASALLGLPVDLALVVFGVAALVGIWLTGVVVDRHLRQMTLVSILAFMLAAVILFLGQHHTVMVVAALAIWGLAFGGAATQLQTAMGRASGESADVANALLTVVFNLAILVAGIGGALVIGRNTTLLPVVMFALAALALVVTAVGRGAAFRRDR
ncbi:MFS transporter [Frondihabitans cladoniiphilus]|uniref:MFS transporter n=2 Tax=Frondihabitans cladoniiphilus TaxID=715785 RepID=A0ABP8VQ80_9MICO